jgi:hypothetical protein
MVKRYGRVSRLLVLAGAVLAIAGLFGGRQFGRHHPNEQPQSSHTSLPDDASTAAGPQGPAADIIVEKKPLTGVSYALAVAEDGSVAVRLTDAPRDVYILDPRTAMKQLLAKPPNDDPIADAAIWNVRLSASWAVWLSVGNTHDRTEWVLRAHNRNDGQEFPIVQEDPAIYQKYPGLDTLPYFELYQDALIWAYYEREGNGHVANVIKMLRLDNRQVTELARLTDSDVDIRAEYLSLPSVTEGAAVWFRGRRDPTDFVLFADTYLKDLNTGSVSKLNTSKHASNPLVTRDYVVWLQRATEPEQVRDEIVLYDRRKGMTQRINPPGDAASSVGSWGPSIGDRFVTWWRNQDSFYLYDTRQGSLTEIAGGNPWLNGSYLTWVQLLPGEKEQAWWAKLPG